MTWDKLIDGQRIKALDKIFMVNGGSIANDQDYNVFITETQITSGTGLIVVAKKGDIGVWNKDDDALIFSRIDSDGNLNELPIYFENCDMFDTEIDEEIFEVLNEFGELGEKHE